MSCLSRVEAISSAVTRWKYTPPAGDVASCSGLLKTPPRHQAASARWEPPGRLATTTWVSAAISSQRFQEGNKANASTPRIRHKRLFRPDFPAQLLQCVDHVGRARPIQLPGVEYEAGLVGQGSLEQAQAIGGAKRWLWPVRRLGSRNETHLTERQRLQDLQRNAQMPQMNRVEGSPSRPIGAVMSVQFRIWPSPSTTHFRDVSPSRPTGPRA